MQKIEVGGQSGVRGKRGVLTRLAKDVRGNTLALVGAALLPLMAMIGSSVDIGVAYMAKTRLQSACDSAALAGRRVLLNDTLGADATDPVRVEATKFFKFNFPDRIYGAAAFTPVITKPVAGTIHIAAATSIPTSIMHLFGFNALPISVTCSASQNFVNTDIMLVLDTTGSMLQDVNGNWTSTVANQKITALKDAVMALYDELAPIQTQLEAGGMRLRYGIVPYSITVNVGAAIRAKSASYLADSWTYPSRAAIFSTSSAPNRVGTSMTNSECNAYVQARTPANSYPSTEKVVARPGSGTKRPCDVTTITYTEGTGATFAWWIHEPVVHDTSVYKTGGTVLLPTRVPGTSTNAAAWNGCIEERDTVDTITSSSGYNIPTGAYDLDIDLIPSSPETKWRPAWIDVLYNPASGIQTTSNSNSKSFASTHDINRRACPTPAKRLTAWTRADLNTYINSLVAEGYTYHDPGMIWGARLLSSGGVFGPDNPDQFNGMSVARHLIFMSDGLMDTQPDAYSAYGIEEIDQRVTGGASDSNSRHNQRFKMACNAAKGKNINIWVIGFGVTPSAEMTECASSSTQVSAASNRAQLIAKFTEIGKNIGTLRLTQ